MSEPLTYQMFDIPLQRVCEAGESRTVPHAKPAALRKVQAAKRDNVHCTRE